MELRTTYARNIRVPVVEGQVVLNKLSQHRNLLLRVIVQNLLRQLSILSIGIHATLFMHKSLLVGSQLARGNGVVIRQESAEEFNVVAVDIMVRIIEHGVIILRSAACLALGGVRQVEWVAEWAIVDGVIQALYRLASQDIV